MKVSFINAYNNTIYKNYQKLLDILFGAELIKTPFYPKYFNNNGIYLRFCITDKIFEYHIYNDELFIEIINSPLPIRLEFTRIDILNQVVKSNRKYRKDIYANYSINNVLYASYLYKKYNVNKEIPVKINTLLRHIMKQIKTIKEKFFTVKEILEYNKKRLLISEEHIFIDSWNGNKEKTLKNIQKRYNCASLLNDNEINNIIERLGKDDHNGDRPREERDILFSFERSASSYDLFEETLRPF